MTGQETELDQWPMISRSVGLIIRAALCTGHRVPVPVDVYEGGERYYRLVKHMPGRGWVALDYPDDEHELGEDIIYEGGDLFAAAFAAVVGRPPSDNQRATPWRVAEAMALRVVV